jgi:hypothetical protein
VRSGIQAAARSGRVYLPSRVVWLLGVQAPPDRGWPFFWRRSSALQVIGVSPVKDHNLCRASMTTKNWYGLSGGRRNQFHQDIRHHRRPRADAPPIRGAGRNPCCFAAPTGGSLG